MTDALQGKVVLVTGGGSGIGRAVARACAREGAAVVVSDVDAAAGAAVADELKAAGGAASFAETDVSQSAQVEALVAQVLERHGRIDGAVNNAGIEGELAKTVGWSEAGFDRTIAVNVKGVWLCMKSEIPAMLETGGGAIVNIASVAGLVGFLGSAGYAASKHAVLGLTKTAALEYSARGVRVNAVCPGPIETPMLDRIMTGGKAARAVFEELEPMRRFGAPEEIADGAVWLLSDAASFVTGVALPIDGGWTAQ